MDPSSNTHGRTSIIPSVNTTPTTIRYRQFLLIIIQPKRVNVAGTPPNRQFETLIPWPQLVGGTPNRLKANESELQHAWEDQYYSIGEYCTNDHQVQAIFNKIDVYYLVNGAPYSNLCY